MSWRERRTGRAGAPLLAVLLLAALGLGACGFRPLYGTAADGTSSFDDLETVQIDPLPDRVGQQLHNLLRDRINPRGQPREPRYVLRISLSERREALAIEEDETATRTNLRLSARFNLVELDSNAVVFKGFSNSINSYNIVESQFATYVSEQDARERALRELSEDIRLRLATYFSGLKAAGDG